MAGGRSLRAITAGVDGSMGLVLGPQRASVEGPPEPPGRGSASGAVWTLRPHPPRTPNGRSSLSFEAPAGDSGPSPNPSGRPFPAGREGLPRTEKSPPFNVPLRRRKYDGRPTSAATPDAPSSPTLLRPPGHRSAPRAPGCDRLHDSAATQGVRPPARRPAGPADACRC